MHTFDCSEKHQAPKLCRMEGRKQLSYDQKYLHATIVLARTPIPISIQISISYLYTLQKSLIYKWSKSSSISNRRETIFDIVAT
jgi:hypothetical protein